MCEVIVCESMLSLCVWNCCCMCEGGGGRRRRRRSPGYRIKNKNPTQSCATPATQSAAASQATNPDQARHPVPWVPRLPRKATVDVRLCHACHVKRRWMSPSATPATQSAAASQATNPDQARHPVPWVIRLPRKTTVDASFVPHRPREKKVDVTKCHACHAKCRGVTGDKSGPSAPPSTMGATPATQNDGGCEFCATPATWKEGGCHQVPRVPRKVPRRHRRQIRTKRATQYHGCHACHAKRRWMRVLCHACHAKCHGVTGDKSGPSAPPSTMSATPATQNDGGCEFCAMPATWNEGGCHQVPRLPHKVPRRHRRQIRTKRATQCHLSHACHAKRRWMRVLCHACHVKRRWMSPSATPATQSAAASQATNPDQARHPVPSVPRLPHKTMVEASFVPRLPRETKVDVTKCHACHAKCRGVTGDKSGPPPSTMSATPATQNDGRCEVVPRLPRETKVDVRLCHACHVTFVYVKLLYVKFVCVKFVC